jgi:hypothetical protein
VAGALSQAELEVAVVVPQKAIATGASVFFE